MKKQTYEQRVKEYIYNKNENERRRRIRKEYEAHRDAYKNSKEGLFEQSVREVVQKSTKAEDDAYRQVLVAIEALREDTFNLVQKFLEMEGEDIKALPLETIEESIKQSSLAFSKLKKMCSTEEYATHRNSKMPTDYEKLFSKLIDKVDIRFALYAPKRSVSIRTIKFHRLPEDLKDKMFERLEKFGLTEDAEYLEAYERVFENQIINKGLQA
ncbi:MAG: hypothetical protein IJ415_00955 [Clostridia bacterium]|nr:hypothetical protein [Clostridia bacterium]